MLAKGRASMSPLTMAGVMPGIASRSFSEAVLASITPWDLPTWASAWPLEAATRQRTVTAIDSSFMSRLRGQGRVTDVPP